MSRRAGAGLRPGAALGLLLVAAAFSAGCGALVGGLRTTPSGLSQSDQELRTLLASGRSVRAMELLEGEEASKLVSDELLRLQYRGLVAHYAGRWEESSRALERAFAVAEDRYTKSVTRALLSLVTNDRILAYDPPRPERLFLHYYGALNYLRRGEPDEAAVEARRLGYVLQQALDEEDSSVPPALGRALSVFAGSVFEVAAQFNDAAVSYRRARAFGERAGAQVRSPGGGHSPAAVGHPPRAGAPVPADSTAGFPAGGSAREDGADPWALRGSAVPGADLRPGPGPGGRVLVVLERGFVAHKVERDVTLFLLPRELRRVQSFRGAAAGDTAAADTAEILDLAERVANRSLGSGSRRRSGRSPRASGADPVLVRIAWPELREASGDPGTGTLRVAGEGSSGEPRIRREEPRFRADLSHAVREAYLGSRPRKMAKSLLRAAAKLSLAEAIEDAASEEDETLGEVLGTSARVAGVLLERADTRSWHLLPARLEVYLLHLPPGTHRLEARVARGSGAGDRVPLGPVEVEVGSLQVVTARDWR